MPSKITRRDLLKLTGLSAAAAFAPASLTSCAQSSAVAGSEKPGMAGASKKPPRNIIFMVADGMSAGVVSLADSFARIVRDPQQGSHWTGIMQSGVAHQGMVETFSLDSIVTDSAAAASAWGSGSRVNSGSLNMLPNGQVITPLAKLVKHTGRGVGLVSTCTITHATPAGFAANVKHRREEEEIAMQYLGDVDVLLGGGSKFFSALTRRDKVDLNARFAEAGYELWQHRDQLMAAKGKRTAGKRTTGKVLGTFAPSHLPFTIDQRQSAELTASVPTLAEMTQAAIDALSNNDKGFFLMVEGGKVDHCAHANDAAGALWDQLAFDDAIGVALAFAQQNADTLIVMTTDHGNANPGLNGMGHGGGSNVTFAKLASFTASTYAMMDQFRAHGKTITPEQVTQIIADATQIQIKASDAQVMVNALTRQPTGVLNRQLAGSAGVLGQILGNHTGIGWTGTSHTADYATLTATGPGSERFAGFGRNTDAFKHITSFWGIDHVNPSMTPQENWRSNAEVYQHGVEEFAMA